MFLLCALLMLEQWKVTDTGIFQPLRAEEVVVREDGHVFILDFDEAQVIHYDASGKKVGTFGKKGKGPGEFTFPISFIYHQQRFYIQDALDTNVSVFSRDGKFEKRFPLPGRGLVIAKSANGWVYGNWDTFGMEEQTKVGLFLAGDNFEDPKLLMEVKDKGIGQGMSVMSDGSNVKASFSPLSARPRLTVSPNGKTAYLTDIYLFQIHVFDLVKGKKVRTIERKDKRIPFDDDWAKERLGDQGSNLPPGTKVEVYSADFFPMIRDMKVMSDGTLTFDRWRGRPDDTHYPLALNPDGTETKMPFKWETLLRLAGVHEGQAYITMYNEGDEEGWLAKVPVKDADAFVKANPEDPEAERSRSISITN